MCCLMLQLTLIASKCSLSISYLYLLPSSIVVFFRSTRSISSQILVHLFSLRVTKGPRTIKKLRERERRVVYADRRPEAEVWCAMAPMAARKSRSARCGSSGGDGR